MAAVDLKGVAKDETPERSNAITQSAGGWLPSSLEARLNYSSHLKRYTRSLLSRAKRYDLVHVHSSIAASQTKQCSSTGQIPYTQRPVARAGDSALAVTREGTAVTPLV